MSYIDIADIRYNVSKIEIQMGNSIRDNDHSKSQDK